MTFKKPLVSRWTWALSVGGVLSCAHPEPEQPRDGGTAACTYEAQEDGILAPGARGEVPTTGEGQFLTLSTCADHAYRFQCHPIPGSQGCALQLLDATTREPLTAPVSSNTGERVLLWKAPAAGRVLLKMSAPALYSGAGEGSSYRYAFDEARDDVGDSIETATHQAVPSSFVGSLEHPSDVDVWRFTIPRGHILDARCGGEAGRWLTTLARIGAAETFQGTSPPFLGELTGGAYPSELRHKNTTGGDIFVRFDISLGSSTLPLSTGEGYQCQVQDLGPDDHPDAPPEATPIALGMWNEVTLETQRDVDVLSMNLLEGHTYKLQTTPLSEISDPLDLPTTVTDEQGSVVEQALSTRYPGSSLTLHRSGRYFFSVGNASDGFQRSANDRRFIFVVTDVTSSP